MIPEEELDVKDNKLLFKFSLNLLIFLLFKF